MARCKELKKYKSEARRLKSIVRYINESIEQFEKFDKGIAENLIDISENIKEQIETIKKTVEFIELKDDSDSF